ncbi:MAG: phosphatidate cytidylyltransferase [Porticoccaceae bacterium]|nr:phosphatidate cytidylyltransferase [Porticoccaceae bacterium]
MKKTVTPMLKQRVITALVLVAAFVWLLVNLTAAEFSLVLLLLVMVAGWEWTNLLHLNRRSSKAGFLGLLLLALAAVGLNIGLFAEFNFALGQQISMIAVGLWAIIFLWLQGYPSSSILWSPRPVLGLIGLLLLVATWVALTSILHREAGRWLLFLAIVIVALADVGGYVAGRLFGKNKLAPIISPGKTWEGFAGGMLLQILLIAGLMWQLPQLRLIELTILVIPVALYSVLGDLFESMIKRHSGVKDSSQLLPGHGGVLDRIDGFMAALPLFSLLLANSSLV